MDLPRTAFLGFSLMLGSSTPPKSENLRKIDSPLSRKKKFQYFLFSVLFSVQKLCDGEPPLFPLQLLEHSAVWLEDILELSNNFDAPVQWIV
jgi:hypothetical protein